MNERSSPDIIRVSRGLDIPLSGEPVQEIDTACRVSRVALLGRDYPGLKPRVDVEVGEEVLCGQVLFRERKDPSINFTSPGAGRVVAINRGARRVLTSVVIELDESDRAPEEVAPQSELTTYRGSDLEGTSADDVEALLLESGLWTALRTRPFGAVPKSGTAPRAIYVTAMDTHPHAPDLDVVLDGLDEKLEAGLAVLVKAGRGAAVRLCIRNGSRLSSLAVEGVTVHQFEGPHPAGLPGLHMNLIDPVGRGRLAWYIGVQDVVAIGCLLLTGRLDMSRVVALGGDPVSRPRLLRTRLGAHIPDLLDSELDSSKRVRIISGSVLHGRDASEEDLAFLGRFDQQVSVVSDERNRQFLGWMAPRLKEAICIDPLLSKLLPRARLVMTTLMNGEPRPLIPIGRYERYMPYNEIVPPLLFRALLTRDVEKAEALGALELEEDDLALCSFVCPSKIDFGQHLREVLMLLEMEWS